MPFELLWRHIGHGAHHHVRCGDESLRRRCTQHRIGTTQVGQAEIHQFRAARREHDVGGLYVAMNDLMAMGKRQCTGDVDGDAQRFGDGQAASACNQQAIRQCLAREQLHDQVGLVAVGADVIQRADMWVGQLRDRPPSPESRPGVPDPRWFRRKNLDGNVAAKLRMVARYPRPCLRRPAARRFRSAPPRAGCERFAHAYRGGMLAAVSVLAVTSMTRKTKIVETDLNRIPVAQPRWLATFRSFTNVRFFAPKVFERRFVCLDRDSRVPA